MKEQEWVVKLINKIDIKDREILEKIQEHTPIITLKLAKELGIKITEPEMTEVKKKGWIFKNPIDKSYNIVLNPIYPNTMKKFTLAHEIAHYLLHKNYIDQCESLDRSYSKELKNFNMIEWEANLLASEIIMPTNQVDQQIEKLKQNDDFETLRLSDKVSLLSQKLQEVFDVSKETADRRTRRALRNLDYIK